MPQRIAPCDHIQDSLRSTLDANALLALAFRIIRSEACLRPGFDFRKSLLELPPDSVERESPQDQMLRADPSPRRP